MNHRKEIQKYRLLIAASIVIVFATVALLIMQYRSLQRTEAQSKATVEANLDLHLLEIVENAKWDILDHANHVFHSIRQQRIRERNFSGIERAFTRAGKRYPEVENFYVILFEPRREVETWSAYSFVPPDPNDPNVQKFEGSPVGKLSTDSAVSDSLLRAWKSVIASDGNSLYTAFDPQSSVEFKQKQYFFHSVYELDRLERTKPLERIGLMVFSADAEKFPYTDYLKKLIEKHSVKEKNSYEFLGNLSYSIVSKKSEFGNQIVSSENLPLRTRNFDASERLFPNLTFGVSTSNFGSKATFFDSAGLGVLLGVSAATLLVIGLLLTWWATRREMKLAQLKSDFLANISHEIKTPITAIRAFGDLLHSGRTQDPERVKIYGGMIKKESDRLTRLISNVLELSQLERGAHIYRFAETDLTHTVAETIDFFKHSLNAGDFDVSLVSPPKPIIAEFNQSAIKQAVLNLLSNSIKYSGNSIENKKIIVELRTDSLNTYIEVRDFGLGISKSEQSDIFRAFHRSANSEIQAKGGVGLGLAIVNEIVKAHTGKISVESELGKGSVFLIQLPISQTLKAEQTNKFSDLEESLSGKYSGN